MINPDNEFVKNAIEIVQTNNIARTYEIVNSIGSQNSIIHHAILHMNFHPNEDKGPYIMKIFDASIVIQDLTECLDKLIGDFTGRQNDKPKFQWKGLK